MAEEADDDDVKAITVLISVLRPLEPQARIHVLDFVFKRLGISLPSAETAAPAAPSGLAMPAASPAVPPSSSASVVDIRTFASEKNPLKVNEKVALVAYYVAHLAPPAERRDYLVADDIKRYFLQADFELPTSPPGITLAHAKNAGYLNALERGQFRLNAVGHNLVAHKLPADEGGLKHKKKTGRKKVSKSKSRSKSR